jgi:hypothetical protein
MKKLHLDKPRYLQHFDELPSVLQDLRQKDGMGSNLYILHICGASPMKELYFDELSTGLKN